MRFSILLVSFVASSATAFAPTSQQQPRSVETSLSMSMAMDRRQALISAGWLLASMPAVASAKPASTWFFDENIENVKEEAQMRTDGKLDLNAAFVGDYKEFVGMFPTAAGKIASHGPYENVKDIYKLEGLTENDKKLFKKYESQFTVNPPGRAFAERINARVST